MSNIIWNEKLINKYNINGPRYTSYPTALKLSEEFDTANMSAALVDNPHQSLCLYVHLPFCHSLCYYCGCNKMVTRHQDKADIYLDYLITEMSMYAPLVGHRSIRQLHLGGGTPTFLTEVQLDRLLAALKQYFEFAEDAELSVEIDPRTCDKNKLAHLRSLGFNRVSYGVQDFDNKVQQTINRIQSAELIAEHMNNSRELGFESINLDLIYGLPYQSSAVFEQSINKVLELNPDRISLFSYAHLPQRFASQRKIPDSSLPSATNKLALMRQGIDRFTQAGYQFIGMDHFAKPSDALAQAQQQGKLQRNFQGYTTDGQDTLLGLGLSSISQVNGVLWQHEKSLKDYYNAIDTGFLPIAKGMSLTAEDKCRAALISQIICHFKLDCAEFCKEWEINDFYQHFDAALQQLSPFLQDGLVTIENDVLQVTDAGRLWVRSICACFDEYLDNTQNRYSKVV